MITYRLATAADNRQLIALTASSGMTGETGLRIDRLPDFFSLLHMRGPTKVFVAVKDNTIVGCLCVSLQQIYVGGQAVPLQYIGDLKVATSQRNKGIGLQLCNEMANYVIDKDADLAFLNVSKGNTKPISFFSNRANIPDFDNIGIFKIHQFVGKRRINTGHQIELSPVTDELVSFFNSYYSKYELGPVITKEKLEDTSNYIIRYKNNIIAAICLVDTMPVKQNVVTHLSGKMKILLSIINAWSSITRTSKMPIVNEPVKMMYIKYLAVNNNEKKQVRALVNHARHIVYQQSYSFVSIGLHEKDPLNACFSGLFRLTFNSVGMLLSIKNSKNLINKVKAGIPFEDYSLV